MMCTCAYGDLAHMMYAPVGLCVVGSPVVFGSNGHLIIQCGPTVIAGLLTSEGSESLRCVAPASMYVMPGTVLVVRILFKNSACHWCAQSHSMINPRFWIHTNLQRASSAMMLCLLASFDLSKIMASQFQACFRDKDRLRPVSRITTTRTS
jgi:hypothetical protein